MVLNDSFYLMVCNSYCKLLMHTNIVFVAYFEADSWQIKPAWNCYQIERILCINFQMKILERYLSLLKMLRLGSRNTWYLQYIRRFIQRSINIKVLKLSHLFISNLTYFRNHVLLGNSGENQWLFDEERSG